MHRPLRAPGAVERGEYVLVEFDEGFELLATDIIYLSGTNDTFARYYQTYPGARNSPGARQTSSAEAGGDSAA